MTYFVSANFTTHPRLADQTQQIQPQMPGW